MSQIQSIQVPPDSTGKRILTNEYTISATTYHLQGVGLLSHDDPTKGQNVDAKGAAFVRFAEGEPVLDPYSNLKVSQSLLIGSYDHSTDSQDDLYTIIESNSATSTYEALNTRIKLETTTTSGSTVQRTTNRYHYYNIGTGLLALLSIQCGDFGKANNIRRWGYYDDNNGVFFELNQTTINIVIRSTIDNVFSEVRTPQSAWSVDTLNGNGISQYELELDEVENYWINIQHPGSIRFGLLNDAGERIIAHIASHGLNLTLQTASLPLRVENINIGTVISSSDLFEYAMAIYHDNKVDYTFWRYSDMSTSVLKTVTSNTPVLSVRSKLTYNGLENRISTYPQTLSVYVSGAPVKMDIIFAGTLSGDSWALSGDSSIEGDTNASSIIVGDGYKFITEYCNVGVNNIDLSKYYELNDEGIMIAADGTTQNVQSFVFTKLANDATGVQCTLTYRELR
jgi:hypothetical protein